MPSSGQIKQIFILDFLLRNQGSKKSIACFQVSAFITGQSCDQSLFITLFIGCQCRFKGIARPFILTFLIKAFRCLICVLAVPFKNNEAQEGHQPYVSGVTQARARLDVSIGIKGLEIIGYPSKETTTQRTINHAVIVRE